MESKNRTNYIFVFVSLVFVLIIGYMTARHSLIEEIRGNESKYIVNSLISEEETINGLKSRIKANKSISDKNKKEINAIFDEELSRIKEDIKKAQLTR